MQHLLRGYTGDTCTCLVSKTLQAFCEHVEALLFLFGEPACNFYYFLGLVYILIGRELFAKSIHSAPRKDVIKSL